MTNPAKRPLFTGKHAIEDSYPRAPQTDWGTNIVTVYDHAGVEHKMSASNAREAIRKSGFTTDPTEAEARRLNPLEPVKHLNFEHGEHGVLTRHVNRTSSIVSQGVQQSPVVAPASTQTTPAA